MRLSESEQQVIKLSIYVLDKHAKIVLFGSRADDKARRGVEIGVNKAKAFMVMGSFWGQ